MRKALRTVGCFFLALVITCSILAMPVSARASDQIDSYNVSASAISGGKIYISFSVTGTGRMTEIGASSISIAKSVNGSWVTMKTYDADDSGMTAANTTRCSGNVTYSGTAGAYYRVRVIVFATDSSGTDSRTVTRYITAES